MWKNNAQSVRTVLVLRSFNSWPYVLSSVLQALRIFDVYFFAPPDLLGKAPCLCSNLQIKHHIEVPKFWTLNL